MFGVGSGALGVDNAARQANVAQTSAQTANRIARFILVDPQSEYDFDL
jgi:hypothetical protein